MPPATIELSTADTELILRCSVVFIIRRVQNSPVRSFGNTFVVCCILSRQSVQLFAGYALRARLRYRLCIVHSSFDYSVVYVTRYVPLRSEAGP